MTGTDWHNSGRVCPPSHGTVVVNKNVLPSTDVMIGQFPATCPPATQGRTSDDGRKPRLHQVYKFSRLDQLSELIDAGVAPSALHTPSTVEYWMPVSVTSTYDPYSLLQVMKACSASSTWPPDAACSPWTSRSSRKASRIICLLLCVY
jgi:hypothetical protein